MAINYSCSNGVLVRTSSLAIFMIKLAAITVRTFLKEPKTLLSDARFTLISDALQFDGGISIAIATLKIVAISSVNNLGIVTTAF